MQPGSTKVWQQQFPIPHLEGAPQTQSIFAMKVPSTLALLTCALLQLVGATPIAGAHPSDYHY